MLLKLTQLSLYEYRNVANLPVTTRRNLHLALIFRKLIPVVAIMAKCNRVKTCFILLFNNDGGMIRMHLCIITFPYFNWLLLPLFLWNPVFIQTNKAE